MTEEFIWVERVLFIVRECRLRWRWLSCWAADEEWRDNSLWSIR